MSAKDCFLRMVAGLNGLVVICVVLAPSSGALAQIAGSVMMEANQQSLTSRYPPGSVNSVMLSDQILAETENERLSIQAQHVENVKQCTANFFVNHCIDTALEQRRASLSVLRSLELEAKLYKRRERVIERDRTLEEARIVEADKVQPQIPFIPKNTLDSADSRLPVEPYTDSPKPHIRNRTSLITREQARDEKEAHKKVVEADNERKRVENIAAYEKKVQQSEARQREIAAKKAEKERLEKAKMLVLPASP